MDRRVNQVRALYVALLGRQPEPAALAVQAQRDPETVVRNILNSQEFKRRNRQTGIPAQTALRERPALGELDEDRVVFLHIPKCGGTTLHHMLGEWYGTDKVHPERHNRLYQWSAANLTSSRVFSGHYDFYSTRLIPGNVRRISFLRDPIARLLSLYHFHRAHRPEVVEQHNLTLARWAQKMDIDDYFSNEEVRAHPAVNNSIARYFSSTPQIPHMWTGQPGPEPEQIDILCGQAVDNLDAFAFIGFMEDYERSVIGLSAALGKPPVSKIVQKQSLEYLMAEDPGMRHIEKQALSERTRAGLEDLVTYDRIVCDAARRKFANPDAGATGR